MKFPFLAGSSLPVTWRLSPVEVPYDAEIEEALIASAVLDRCLDSRVGGPRRLDTPDLKIEYRAPHEPRFGA